jgi:hypothetical protein
MVSRRNFIWGAACAALPLKSALEPYGEEFFRLVRSRFINIVNNGYLLVPERFEVAPPRDGKRMTYGEFMSRKRAGEREAFSRLSEEEKIAAWWRRAAWLKSELPRLVKFGQRVDQCPVCSTVELQAHCWPTAFSCDCGAVIVLCVWLPDGKERALITFPVSLS